MTNPTNANVYMKDSAGRVVWPVHTDPVNNAPCKHQSLFAELDNVTYTIGVDFDYFNPDLNPVVIVRCKGTKVETRFGSGDFVTDFDAAQNFAADMVSRTSVNPKFVAFCISFDSSFDNFILLNTKYSVIKNYQLTLA